MSGWISVVDRLPIEEGSYTGNYKCVDIIVYDGFRVGVSAYCSGQTLEFWGEFYKDGMFVDITHWQPLPDPPEDL